jgi:hypothetical protein
MNNRSAERPESLESAASPGVAGAFAPACTVAGGGSAGFAFDFGTSPHGLSAGLHQTEQETREPLSCHPSSAKPVLPLPEVYRSYKVQSACKKIQAAAKEHFYPLVFTGSQIKHMKRALSIALDDAIEALECEPADFHHEIQPDIDAYNDIQQALRLAIASRGNEANEGWRETVI